MELYGGAPPPWITGAPEVIEFYNARFAAAVAAGKSCTRRPDAVRYRGCATRYWVYFDPNWDFRTLNLRNNLQFWRDTVAQVGPLMASDNPNLATFRDHGGKVVMWHGFADQLIVPQGTIDYYDAVTQALGGGYAQTQQFARLFMAPGVGHCGGGSGPQPQALFDAVVNWVEHGVAPDRILASKAVAGGTQTRPLCPYPALAHWTGVGSTDGA